MKALALLVLLGAAGYGAWAAYERFYAAGPAPLVAAPVKRTPAPPSVIDQCRDDCEQRAILLHQPDAVLRLCRATCDAQVPPRPYEPIRSITRAPADHRPAPLSK